MLWNETKPGGNLWSISVKNFFNSTDDSDLFRTREVLEADGWKLRGNVFTNGEKHMLPVFEGKMVHLFDHRWSSYYNTGNEDRRRLTITEKQDPSLQAEPRYWIAEDGPIPTHRKGRDVTVPGTSERLAELKWDQGPPSSPPPLRDGCAVGAISRTQTTSVQLFQLSCHARRYGRHLI